MKLSAVRLFVGVSAVLLAVLTTDRYVHRSRLMPAPAGADSLAGVVARLTGTDSAQIALVKWQESPESWLGLNWISTDAYRYRDSTLTGTAPEVGYADQKTQTITFAKHAVGATLIKHELGHLFLHTGDHPAAIFQRIESYTGR